MNQEKKVVAIRTHSNKAFKYGEVYTVYGYCGLPCNCKGHLIDIGIKTDLPFGICTCGERKVNDDGIHWVCSNSFVDVDELDAIEIEEIEYVSVENSFD